MTNPNQQLLDAIIYRRIIVERYSTARIKEVVAFLTEMERDIIAKVANATPGNVRYLETLLADVRQIQAAAYRTLTSRMEGHFQVLAGEHLAAVQGALSAAVNGTVTRLGTNAVFQAAMARPMQGALLKDWLADLGPRARERLDRSLTLAYTEGESVGRMVRRVRDTVGISKRGAAALVRTANSHITAMVESAAYVENADLIKSEMWVSILDSRTTPICRARSGKRWPVGEGPEPPAHIGCRSRRVAILDGYDEPLEETYQQWLKRQPADVQDKILGPKRGKLFRSGEYTVQSFVDERGKLIPLSKLAA